jgi:ribonuclease P protein component
VTPKEQLVVLRRRAEFLAAAQSGKKWVAPGLIVQAGMPPKPTEESIVRYGLTASGKIGGAVVRNRARRRMRALAHDVLPVHAKPGYDYVLIARHNTPTRSYADLRKDLVMALKKLGLWHGEDHA